METYPCYFPKPLWSEQDPEDWWQATIRSVRRVDEAKAKLKPADVKAIGLSGQMHGSVFLDKNNKVIRRAILWNDQRTAAECREMEEPRRRPGEPDQAGGQPGHDRLHRPEDPLAAEPRAAAFREDPQGAAAEGRNPPPPDRRVCHRSERRQRHVAVGRGPAHVVEEAALGVGAGRRPAGPLLRIGGSDRHAHARRRPKLLGLSTDCVVVGGAGDCAAGAVGNGIVATGVLSTSIGTSGVMFVHCDEVKIDPAGRVHTFCHAVHGKWHMMGVNLSAGGSLQWFRNELCQADVAAGQAGQDAKSTTC